MGIRIGLVTGGNRGIGAGLTKALLDAHPELDEVWVMCRNLSLPPRPHVRYVTADVSSQGFPKRLTTLLKERDATVTHLIVNAGIASASSTSVPIMPGHTDEISAVVAAQLNDDLAMVRTNVEGAIRTIRSCVPFMTSGSKILLIGSISAFYPTPGLAVYTATKAFIRNLSLALREELKPLGISVTVAHPAKIRTLAVADVEKQTKSVKLKMMPSQSLGSFSRKSIAAMDRGKAEITPGGYAVMRIVAAITPASLRARSSRLF